MAFARWEKPVQDEDGNLVTGIWVEVRDADADGNPLAPNLYSDRDGAVSLDNPFFVADGAPFFHVVGGCYHVRVYKTGLDATFAFQGVGTATERDIAEGTGDVTGPDDAIDGEIAVFDGATGKIIKRGGLLAAAWAAMLHALTNKTTPVDADEIGIGDSAASYAGKRVTFLQAWTNYFKAKADALYQPIASILTAFVGLPNSSGVLVNDGSGGLSWGAGGYTLLTEQTTTSGTTKDFTIPAGAKSIVVMFNGVSVGGSTFNLGVQIGDSGGIENTGYSSMASSVLDGSAASLTQSNSQFLITSTVNNTVVLSGSVMLSRMNGTHRWVASGNVGGPGTPNVMCSSGGAKTLSAELTTVRLISTFTLDAGSVSVMWQ